LLFIALLPSLLFFGHWQLSLAIPGTGYRVGTRAVHVEAEHHDEANGDHESHCHESAASCSDAPLTSISWFAHLSEAVGLIGAAALLISLSVAAWLPASARAIPPELPPPNSPVYC
jgi:hypothetical protein